MDRPARTSRTSPPTTCGRYLDSHLQSVECGPYGTVGGPYENMAKYSEDFSVGTWDKNGGTCTVVANAIVAPDGNPTADAVTASGAAGLIRQNIAGLVANGQYTFYVWLKVASGTMTVSLGILDNGWTTWLAGPTAVTLTTVLAAVQGDRHDDGRRDGALGGDRPLHGRLDDRPRVPCVGRVPPAGQRSEEGVRADVGLPDRAGRGGSGVRATGRLREQQHGLAVQSARAWLDARGPHAPRGHGGRRTDHRGRHRQRVSASRRLMGATNPSGWSGVLKVKNPAGVTAGYILLYSNP